MWNESRSISPPSGYVPLPLSLWHEPLENRSRTVAPQGDRPELSLPSIWLRFPLGQMFPCVPACLSFQHVKDAANEERGSSPHEFLWTGVK